MPARWVCWVSIFLAVAAFRNGEADECRLVRYPAIPVTMQDGYPTIPVAINGIRTRLLVDTGAFVDVLSPAEATEFALPLSSAPPDYRISGGFGDLRPRVATVKTLTLGRLSFANAKFLVGANDLGDGIAGALGENLYLVFDVEFDFANGMMRFIRASHCSRRPLAYWAAASGQPVSAVQLQGRNMWTPQLRTTVQINGHDVYAIIDTGASASILSVAAAESAGLWPGSPGAVPIGNSGAVWTAAVREIRIGDEKIEHTRILVQPFENAWPHAWMVLGNDFFLSHHVYLATNQAMLYFTYNGGPVFDLSAAHAAHDKSGVTAAMAALADALPQSSSPPAAAPPDSRSPADSTAAAALMRRGLAYAGRSQFQQAIDDLTRACRMAPRDANCRYQRGMVYWRNRRSELALQDLDAAIGLDPGSFQARLLRANVRLSVVGAQRQLSAMDRPQPEQTIAGHSPPTDSQFDPELIDEIAGDLDAVVRLAPSQADLRLSVGRDYEDLGQYSQAVREYDLWITYHPEDSRLAVALAWRCGSRAQANVDLGQALQDCNRAYDVMKPSWWSSKTRWSAPWIAAVLNVRSVIDLRRGNLSDAAADADSAIRLQPGDAYALYTRGLARVRERLKKQGYADLSAAEKLRPSIGGGFTSIGLTP